MRVSRDLGVKYCECYMMGVTSGMSDLICK